ncbi:lysozyme inhibitor LprI family protein [Burkholderia plantarii]|uniref:lysozyme inhibitor LprI family protein n=1 Tax=Burkholderia plantarii TaxID=41899 RepID=UPI0009F32CFF|nr:lysozyme inhibitor LprI family protein [Burkholderia plantarii]
MTNPAWALDCQHPNSTSENIQCASQAFNEADAQLNATYGRVLATLTGPDEGRWYHASTRMHLVAAQRAWIRYRDENCTAVRWDYESGSIRDEMEWDCKKTLTEQRIKALTLFSGPG